jgi:hypothetical protein
MESRLSERRAEGPSEALVRTRACVQAIAREAIPSLASPFSLRASMSVPRGGEFQQ